MEEIPLNNIDRRLQKQIENARKSISKNPSFAINILGHVTETQPACLEVRQLLREAQYKLGRSFFQGKRVFYKDRILLSWDESWR